MKTYARTETCENLRVFPFIPSRLAVSSNKAKKSYVDFQALTHIPQSIFTVPPPVFAQKNAEILRKLLKIKNFPPNAFFDPIFHRVEGRIYLRGPHATDQAIRFVAE